MIDVPGDIMAAMARVPAAAARLDRPTASYKREYLTWIADAERRATRARLIGGTVDRLARADEV